MNDSKKAKYYIILDEMIQVSILRNKYKKSWEYFWRILPFIYDKKMNKYITKRMNMVHKKWVNYVNMNIILMTVLEAQKKNKIVVFTKDFKCIGDRYIRYGKVRYKNKDYKVPPDGYILLEDGNHYKISNIANRLR